MTLARVVRWVETYAPLSVGAAAVGTTLAERPAATSFLLASGLCLQAALAIRHASRRDVRVQFAGGTIPAGFLAVVLCSPPWDLVLVPLGTACALVGVSLLATATVRARAARAVPRRSRPKEEPSGAWRRDLAAAALVAPLLLLTLLLAPLTSLRIPMDWTRPDIEIPPRPEMAQTPPDERGPPDVASEPGGSSGSDARGQGSEPDPFLLRTIMEVRPSRGGRPVGRLGSLYLRGIPYADGDDGLWHEDIGAAQRRTDAADGVADGWCDLETNRSPSGEVDLSIRQRHLETTTSGELVVHSPPGTTSVQLSSVRAEQGGVVLTRRGARTTFEYQLALRRQARAALLAQASLSIAMPRPRWRAPAGSKLVLLEKEAAAATATARSDLARVRAVMATLRDGYRYESVVEAADQTSALESFVLRRGGSPEQFARAGALMLRSLGIPARVGTGYLATTWDSDRGAYVVQARDRHAWVEVPFAGHGWVVFDPTPFGTGSPVEDDAADGEGEDDAFIPPWDLDEDPSFLESIRRWFRDRFADALDWIAENPWPFVCAVVLALLLAARSLRLRALRLAGADVAAPAAAGPWQELLDDLAKRGWRRRPAQTALEFAHAVVAGAGAGYTPLLDLTRRQQAARFGGRPLGPTDEDDIRAFRASL